MPHTFGLTTRSLTCPSLNIDHKQIQRNLLQIARCRSRLAWQEDLAFLKEKVAVATAFTVLHLLPSVLQALKQLH